MYLDTFLEKNRFRDFEGYSQQVEGQVADLVTLTATPRINVMEIGFNAGHSAEVFLMNNDTLTLTSFDLGVHDYVIPAHAFLSGVYPNRHTLILGDSTVTVPRFIHDTPGKTFDVIFIDGGHEYEVAKADLENCMKLAHKDTIVMLDDTVYRKGWTAEYTVGPTTAWTEAVESGKVLEMGKRDYLPGRGMSWGKYSLSH